MVPLSRQFFSPASSGDRAKPLPAEFPPKSAWMLMISKHFKPLEIYEKYMKIFVEQIINSAAPHDHPGG
jgi:hypothetical protein